MPYAPPPTTPAARVADHLRTLYAREQEMVKRLANLRAEIARLEEMRTPHDNRNRN